MNIAAILALIAEVYERAVSAERSLSEANARVAQMEGELVQLRQQQAPSS